MSAETITIDRDEGALRVIHSWPCEKCEGSGGLPGRSLAGSPCVFVCGECSEGTVTDRDCWCDACAFIRQADLDRRMRHG